MTKKNLFRSTAALLAALLLLMQLPVGFAAMEDAQSDGAQTSAVVTEAEESAEPEESAAEPEQSEAEESAAEPEQSEAEESAAEPEQSEAEESAVEPEQSEAEESAAEPEQSEAEESAVEPESVEPEESAVEAEEPVEAEKPANRPKTLLDELWNELEEEARRNQEEPDPVDPQDVEGNVYAVIYEDGAMVFQNGDVPEEGRASVGIYHVDLLNPYRYGKIDGEVKTTAPWYKARDKVKKVVFKDRISPKYLSYWFFECVNLNAFEHMENLDTSKVEKMRDIFYGCETMESVPVDDWDTSSLTDMHGVFAHCYALKEVNMSKWDTSDVTDMSGIFGGDAELKALDLSTWSTSKVTNIRTIFGGCTGLESLDVSTWDTSHVENMEMALLSLVGLKELDLSSWDTSACTNFSYLFAQSANLETIYATDAFVTDAVAEGKDGNMFTNCQALVGAKGTKYDDNHTDREYARIDREGKPGYFTWKQVPNPVQVTETFTKTVDMEKDQSFQLDASANGAPLRYQSDSKGVQVDENGKVTIAKGFAGEATITVTAEATEQYLSAEATVKLTMKPCKNTVKATGSYTRKVNTRKAQSFRLKASANGAPVRYKSSSKKVQVDENGKVTIAKGFVGKATITVTAEATEQYQSAKKKVRLTVNPSAAKLTGVYQIGWKTVRHKKVRRKKVRVRWKQNKTGKGYELQLSREKDFGTIDKKVKVKKNTAVKVDVKGLKKARYYVRIRTVSGETHSAWSAAKTVKIQ